MSLPGSRRPSGELPSTTIRRTPSGNLPATMPRRTASGEMLAMNSGHTSSGHFRSANPEHDAFRPLIELGRGGMARVYLAEKTTRGLRRLVVLKILEPSLSTDPEMRAAFRREAEVCVRLNHPNVVQVFEVVEEASSPIMVMEYVEGISLSQIITRAENRLPIRLHVHVLMQVLAGLHYFHELRDEDGNPLSAVHRDVSPQNVLVMHEGAVKVLDFGIAKVRGTGDADATQAGTIKGKLSYMPPEQLVGDTSIDRRADIFPVGVMLWEAFARRRLWDGWESQNMTRALMNGSIPSIREACPWISKEMEEVIVRATAVNREHRFETALEMQVALEQCLLELGGAVQQREVATFMETEFGEWRRERQRLVDTEMRKPALALDTVLEVSEIEDISSESSLGPASGQLAPGADETLYARRSKWVVWAIASALSAVVAFAVWHFGFANREVHSEKGGPAAEAKPRVRVQIVASPLEAEIFLDGKPLGQNPWHAELEASPRNAHVEVRAPGYETSVQQLDVSRDADLSVRLEPRAAGSVPPAPAAAAPSLSRDSTVTDQTKRSVRAAPKAAVPHAPLKPAIPAPPARNCSPPYVLDADGVKTYKPECL
jgi:eukaryotic-like serine/threonine-protein kinase